MSNPTICFTHDDALDLFRGENGARFGGAETQVYLLARTLADASPFDVRVVTNRDPAGATHEGIDFVRGRSPISQGVPLISRVINRQRAEAPYRSLGDGVLVQTIAGPNTVAVWRAARKLGLKFVYRMSCDADVDGRLLTSPLKNDYLRALADADGVMAQSPYQQQRLRTELSVESMVVPNLVELPAKASDSEGTYVLWVGRAAPVKRPWVFIETARTLPDINFVMVMPREDHLFWLSVTPETETLPNLQLIPGAPYFEMDQHYRGAAMLAGTSAFEGFPNVFLQAAAHGKPVVSLDGDPGGMLKQHNAGYDAEGDIESFRARIVQWMADASERRRVGSSAREYVTSVHSPASVTPALVEFFSQVLGT